MSSQPQCVATSPSGYTAVACLGEIMLLQNGRLVCSKTVGFSPSSVSIHPNEVELAVGGTNVCHSALSHTATSLRIHFTMAPYFLGQISSYLQHPEWWPCRNQLYRTQRCSHLPSLLTRWRLFGHRWWQPQRDAVQLPWLRCTYYYYSVTSPVTVTITIPSHHLSQLLLLFRHITCHSYYYYSVTSPVTVTITIPSRHLSQLLVHIL